MPVEFLVLLFLPPLVLFSAVPSHLLVFLHLVIAAPHAALRFIVAVTQVLQHESKKNHQRRIVRKHIAE
ncbi:transmembrane protein, putative [Medicago truncatula]|uniref:Transmembrane protein, putative n=1 Tax=Medicago truncatula TaxID=3880 RepID=A0A072VBL5_MEDTR|nr:transmembrane protein, putative [Medicago truncatula]